MVTTNTGQPKSNQKYSEVKDDLQKSGEELSQSLKGTGEEVSKEAKTKAEGAKNYAAEEMEELSNATEAAAQALSDGQHEKLSSYIRDIAGYVDGIAASLRDKSADDLMHDVERTARENPALFVAGGLAVGLGIARLAKSGLQRSSQKDVTEGGSQPFSGEQYPTERFDDFTSGSERGAASNGMAPGASGSVAASSTGNGGRGHYASSDEHPSSSDSDSSKESSPYQNI